MLFAETPPVATTTKAQPTTTTTTQPTPIITSRYLEVMGLHSQS